jgi:hypothetical protein
MTPDARAYICARLMVNLSRTAPTTGTRCRAYGRSLAYSAPTMGGDRLDSVVRTLNAGVH